MTNIVLTTPEELQEVIVRAITASNLQAGANINPLEQLMDTQTTCGYLGITKPTLMELVKDGKIYEYQMGERTRRYKLSEVNDYINSLKKVV